MPPDPRDPHEWLRYARSSLAKAEAGQIHEAILYADLCFDAQQAAEKALKALCIAQGIVFPRTHSLERLLGLLESNGIDVPDDVAEAGILTLYATVTRYPADTPEVAKSDYQEALSLARAVFAWVERQLLPRP